MKIGIFSDFYHPSINGVAVVIDILYDNLTKLGHEVVIVAPRPGLRAKHGPHIPGKNVIWIPAFEFLFFEDYLTSVFSPTRTVKRIEKEHLDAVMIFTPAQVGLLGAYIAKRNRIPLIEQYSTDLAGYVAKYPGIIVGMFALSMQVPFALKMKLPDIVKLSTSVLSFHRQNGRRWSGETITKMLTVMHNNTDLVIALSDKLASQMEKDGVKTKIKILPTGVDKLPGSMAESKNIRDQLGIDDSQKVIMYVGRIGAEKNLDLLLNSFEKIAKKHQQAVLVFVGDYSYREALEAKAKGSNHSDRIIFTGRKKRSDLGSIYMAADIFAFPSLTDTQALVLNEAAHAGLPIVWCDRYVNSVVQDGVNGICARPTIASFARALDRLLNDASLRWRYGRKSAVLAKKFSEKKMTQELLKAIETL